MTSKKSFFTGFKTLVRMAAFTGLLQGGCSFQSEEEAPSDQAFPKKTRQYLVTTDLTPDEEYSFNVFMQKYATHSPSAKKILEELANQGVALKLFTQDLNEDNLFRAGESTEDVLFLNRLIKEKKVSFENTFFHEAEHVIHLKKAHQEGINARSFSSLNDVYIYATLLEALAYRKASLCQMEYDPKGKTLKKIEEEAEDIFTKRLLTESKDKDERLSYETDAIKMANSETNQLPNQVYFKSSPDWNQIVSLLSRGEVKEISVLPQPTLTFLGVCLFRELSKHPDAESLNDLDISCVLKNKQALQKDQKAIKETISNLLMETYGLCRNKKPSLPKKTFQNFLFLIGWPNAQQMEQIKQKKITFQEVRDANLEKFKTEDLFDQAIELLKSPEVKVYGVQDMKKYAKMLEFEKRILIPQNLQKSNLKQSGR